MRYIISRFAVAIAFLAVGQAWAGGSFQVSCPFSHHLPDDPIVFPELPGASHRHDFEGGSDASAFSTYHSMRDRGTSCTLPADTAGYWTPALYRNGVKIDPKGRGPDGRQVRMRVYYNRSNLASGTRVLPPPADLRVIAGNGHATSAEQNPKLGKEIYWGCSDNSVPGKHKAPPASCPTGIITLHVGFPNCWDGVLTHANDTAHLVYPRSGYCPSSHPYPLPRVIVRWEYPVGYSTGTIDLASGPTFTAHGDFWNTWDQAALEELVERCINAGVSCGTL